MPGLPNRAVKRKMHRLLHRKKIVFPFARNKYFLSNCAKNVLRIFAERSRPKTFSGIESEFYSSGDDFSMSMCPVAFSRSTRTSLFITAVPSAQCISAFWIEHVRTSNRVEGDFRGSIFNWFSIPGNMAIFRKITIFLCRIYKILLKNLFAVKIKIFIARKNGNSHKKRYIEGKTKESSCNRQSNVFSGQFKQKQIVMLQFI